MEAHKIILVLKIPQIIVVIYLVFNKYYLKEWKNEFGIENHISTYVEIYIEALFKY